jgi:hypothetical protein
MDKRKQAQIQSRLEKLAQLNKGRLTPEGVVREAKDPKSPLHDQFDWNDSTAAHQYRLSQARDLIRSVRIEVTTDQRVVSTVRYVRDPEADAREQGYVDVAKLRGEDDLAREALMLELTRVEGAMDRASSIAISLGLEAELSSLLDHVRALREHPKLAMAA